MLLLFLLKSRENHVLVFCKHEKKLTDEAITGMYLRLWIQNEVAPTVMATTDSCRMTASETKTKKIQCF
jgi:hypothetical protein